MEIKVTSVKIVEAYKTTDEKLFLDEELAIQHQKQLDKLSIVSRWVVKHCSYSMSKQDIVDILVEYGGEIGV